MDELRNRIDRAIARVKASRAADEVLAEITRTHALVPTERIAPCVRDAMEQYNALRAHGPAVPPGAIENLAEMIAERIGGHA